MVYGIFYRPWWVEVIASATEKKEPKDRISWLMSYELLPSSQGGETYIYLFWEKPFLSRWPKLEIQQQRKPW